MRRFAYLALTMIATLGACGDNRSDDPFDKLPIEGDGKAEITAPGFYASVHVARDKFGVAHIRGESTGDVGFAQGYIMAHDRLAQMDTLRRFGAGTLSEQFGLLDNSVINTDLEMRVHRMKPLAQQTWDMLKASTDDTDKEVVLLLQRFADGVNAYAKDLQSGKKWDLDPNVIASFDPSTFVEWTPVDSLVLGRFQAFALSWSSPFETDATEMFQKIRTQFEDTTVAAGHPRFDRKGVAKDLMKFTPVGEIPTIDGFPNVATDTGSRSDAGRADHKRELAGPIRPVVPQELFDQARTFFNAKILFNGPFGSLGPHAFMQPWSGSNNWAVGPKLANGQALLATDQHLQLPNPSIFYPTHITVGAPGEEPRLDVMGITFPGIPGVILGTNGKVAWSATVSEHDVNDIYLETIAPCPSGTGDCVAFNGSQVPIEKFDEDIGIGAKGNVTSHLMVSYETVPHHGPMIPKVVDHNLVPRTSNRALSIKYTGYQPTFEIRALWNLAHAKSVDEGFKALKDFSYGSQNWTMIDVDKNIVWTTNAKVPNRPPAAYSWNVTTNPDGLAPFLVLPGDGTAEWNGYMDTRYVPHAINPDKGYLATANADPVGATFDGDPLDQKDAAGNTLYAGVTYAAGVREERISQLIESFGTNVTLDNLASIQRDTRSNVGEHLVVPIKAALVIGADANPPADVKQYVTALSPADTARLVTAKRLMENWSRATPIGSPLTPAGMVADGAASEADITDSAATALFNTWMHFFIEQALGDEFTAMEFDVWRLDDNQVVRIVHAMLNHPETFLQSAATSQPILCDDMTTVADESCTQVILASLVAAMTHLESADGFGSADVSTWRWGKLHTLTITPLFPNAALNLGPFAKAGDNFAVNRSDQGWGDLDFSQYADGPAQRFLAQTTADGRITVKWALPGGTVFDSRAQNPHYRDLLDNYYLKDTHFDAPFTLDEIVAAGESRWTFR